jgi:ribokinase
MTAEIVVVGSANTDMVVQTERIPKPGETVLGGEFILAAGGKGANQAVSAARLGASVTLVARVGEDIFGDRAIQNFQQEGINTRYVFRDAGSPSGVALIIVDRKGENVISVAPGANGRLSQEDVHLASSAIEKAQVLLLQLEVPLDTVRSAARLAFEAGVKVILNPAPAQELDDDLLSHVSVLTPNETETEILTGIPVSDEESAQRAAAVLHDRGVESVIITMGARGSFISSADTHCLVPSRRITAVDTTAAGDAFNGALACTLAEGTNLETAVRLANLAGALAATRLGAQPSLPTREQLRAFREQSTSPFP